MKTKIASFATTLRATSLVKDLSRFGIEAEILIAKHLNKNLPPPRKVVVVSDSYAIEAKRLMKEWGY